MHCPRLNPLAANTMRKSHTHRHTGTQAHTTHTIHTLAGCCQGRRRGPVHEAGHALLHLPAPHGETHNNLPCACMHGNLVASIPHAGMRALPPITSNSRSQPMCVPARQARPTHSHAPPPTPAVQARAGAPGCNAGERPCCIAALFPAGKCGECRGVWATRCITRQHGISLACCCFLGTLSASHDTHMNTKHNHTLPSAPSALWACWCWTLCQGPSGASTAGALTDC